MYHDMRLGSAAALAPKTSAFAEVSGLLARYPNLGEAELARLINLYRDLPLVESALLMTDGALATTLDAFVADHHPIVRSAGTPLVALLLLAAAAAALLTMLAVSS